jgi:hypothetical protein
MEKLSENWLTQDLIDFEYKKYILLAYLQRVSESFEETKLYPALSELVSHYRNVIALRNKKAQLYNQFPGRVSQADFKNFKLIYEKLCEDDKLMHELQTIIEFSIPRFKIMLDEGKKIYDFIESQINIFPVGIVPIRFDEGYLFLKSGKDASTRVYEYQITIYDQPDDKYRAIAMHYITSYEKTICNTYEKIKQDLLMYNRNFPNPATYVIETELVLPIEDTLLPLAKRSLVKYITAMAG